MSFVICSDSNNYSEHQFEWLYFKDTMVISPSKQFAIVKVHSKNKDLMVVDIVNKAINRIIWKFEWKELSVWYWLSDDIITLFSDIKEPHARSGECYSQFVYKCDFKDPKSEFELIQKRYKKVLHIILFELSIIKNYSKDIPFAHDDPRRSNIYAPVDPVKIELNGHDFLFVKSFEYQLVPFNPLGGPSLPPFSLNLVDFLRRFWREGHEGYYTSPQYQFTCYKNKIYFQLRVELTESRAICDRFFVIELTAFNLTTRKIETAPLDFNNPNIVTFKRITPGTFELPLTLTWQEGSIVIIYEMSHNRQRELLAERKVVIVDLENETVREKIIKHKFTFLTFYTGFLLLWNISETDGSISFKLEFPNDHVPKLKDICTMKMLSQPNKNKEFTEIYDKIIGNYH